MEKATYEARRQIRDTLTKRGWLFNFGHSEMETHKMVSLDVTNNVGDTLKFCGAHEIQTFFDVMKLYMRAMN